MAKNTNLHRAKENKNDEFYTQYNDIAEELKNYKKHFNGKTILCNCDDPKESKFWQYFEAKFEDLNLKKLISTHYNKDGTPSYALIFEGKYDENNLCITQTIPLNSNGDFRSEECIEFLKEADIVVTNPPFSLFREYVAQLMKYEKKFLIIGNLNAIKYKEIFPLIKENKIWLGHNQVKEFNTPNQTTKKFGNIYWFTNLDNEVRHRKIVLLQDYDINDYPKYDNYDAIDVGKIGKNGEWKADIYSIPAFYDGIMGVPITYINKYNPQQFEIIGIANHGSDNEFDLFKPMLNNQYVYARILIKRKDLI